MKKLFIAILVVFALASSPAVAAKKPKMTPMQLQSIQSKEFEVGKPVAFGAVMTVLQDLGYIVKSADLGSGFITAASPNKNKTNFWGAMAGVSSSGNTVMTAFLMQMPNGRTRIRLNFVNSKTSSSSYGSSSRKDKPILDPAVYNNAWERIDEALFVMGVLTEKALPPPTTASMPNDINTSHETPSAGRVAYEERPAPEPVKVPAKAPPMEVTVPAALPQAPVQESSSESLGNSDTENEGAAAAKPVTAT